MKRSILLFAVFLGLSAAVSSCSKCYSCNFGSGDVREYCSKDNPDGVKGLKMTIKAYEDQGYTCTEK